MLVYIVFEHEHVEKRPHPVGTKRKTIVHGARIVEVFSTKRAAEKAANSTNYAGYVSVLEFKVK